MDSHRILPAPGAQPKSLPAGYRGRLAPSPTGLLHVGHARTFWAAYTRARAAKGTLVLRVDDLDVERSKAEFVDAAVADLRWLGIRWQEGPDKFALERAAGGGAYGPYVQSRRHGLYSAAFRRLMKMGLIYPCRCSRKEVAAAASAPHEGQAGHPPQDGEDEPLYPGTCRELRLDMGQLPGPTSAGLRAEMANWRFRVPDGAAVEFHDENLGMQRFVAGVDFGDFLVWRRDNSPSYQLACAVDDAEMRVTEVVRGADLLKSTARQILLLSALGEAIPQWFHCALVGDHQGRRLAKRFDALSIRALRQQGRTPMNILSADLPVLV